MTTEEFKIILQIFPESMAVCKLSPHEALPLWLNLAEDKFFSITKTKEELSIVCEQSIVPKDIQAQAQKQWRMFKIKGQMDFDLVGILKQVISPLSENNIGIFAMSTFDTDYILVQEKDFGRAIEILRKIFQVEN